MDRRGFEMLGLALIGAGCMSDIKETGAARQEAPDAEQYYVFADGKLLEANGATGECQAQGGCTVPPDLISFEGLGFTTDEQQDLDGATRKGEAVLYAKITALPLPDSHGGGGTLITSYSVKVSEVWRLQPGRELLVPVRCDPAVTDCPEPAAFYQVHHVFYIMDPATADPESVDDGILPSHDSYGAQKLNAGGFVLFRDQDRTEGRGDVPNYIWADVGNRSGLIVQGYFTQDGDGNYLRTANFFRRWVPRAQYDCDRGCQGFGSCTQCDLTTWECAEVCGVAAPAGQ